MRLRYFKNKVTLTYKEELCTGCGMCVEVCPRQVFLLDMKKAKLQDKDACMECGACAKNCAFNAIDVRPGVGCAAALLYGRLKGTAPECGCGTECVGNSGKQKSSASCC